MKFKTLIATFLMAVLSVGVLSPLFVSALEPTTPDETSTDDVIVDNGGLSFAHAYNEYADYTFYQLYETGTAGIQSYDNENGWMTLSNNNVFFNRFDTAADEYMELTDLKVEYGKQRYDYFNPFSGFVFETNKGQIIYHAFTTVNSGGISDDPTPDEVYNDNPLYIQFTTTQLVVVESDMRNWNYGYTYNHGINTSDTDLKVRVYLLKRGATPPLPAQPQGNLVINGETNILTDVDNPIDVATIKSGLYAIDNVDGRIESDAFELVRDDYTANKNKLGKYELEFKVSDSSNNEAHVVVKVQVYDAKPPVITGKALWDEQSYKNKLTITEIQNALTVSDNYDTAPTITVKSDEYTENFNRPNDNLLNKFYSIVFVAKDGSGNASEFEVKVKVVDDIAPVITGEKKYPATPEEPVDLNTVKAGLTAVDEIDGNCEVKLVSDGYTANKNKPGKYTVRYQASDKSGNTMNYDVEITVSDTLPPVIYTSDAFINVDGELNWTQEQIIDFLIKNGRLDPQTTAFYNINPDLTTYSLNAKPGDYLIVLNKKTTAPSELKDTLEIQISVAPKVANNNQRFLDTPLVIAIAVVGVSLIAIATSGVIIRRKRRVEAQE